MAVTLIDDPNGTAFRKRRDVFRMNYDPSRRTKRIGGERNYRGEYKGFFDPESVGINDFHQVIITSPNNFNLWIKESINNFRKNGIYLLSLRKKEGVDNKGPDVLNYVGESKGYPYSSGGVGVRWQEHIDDIRTASKTIDAEIKNNNQTFLKKQRAHYVIAAFLATGNYYLVVRILALTRLDYIRSAEAVFIKKYRALAEEGGLNIKIENERSVLNSYYMKVIYDNENPPYFSIEEEAKFSVAVNAAIGRLREKGKFTVYNVVEELKRMGQLPFPLSVDLIKYEKVRETVDKENKKITIGNATGEIRIKEKNLCELTKAYYYYINGIYRGVLNSGVTNAIFSNGELEMGCTDKMLFRLVTGMDFDSRKTEDEGTYFQYYVNVLVKIQGKDNFDNIIDAIRSLNLSRKTAGRKKAGATKASERLNYATKNITKILELNINNDIEKANKTRRLIKSEKERERRRLMDVEKIVQNNIDKGAPELSEYLENILKQL